jgi:hypothetical protein
MLRVFFHLTVFVILSLLSQLGGIAWLVALTMRRRIITFIIVYAFLSITSLWIAPLFGRVPLNCSASGNLHMQSMLYCTLNRHYVSPEVKNTAQDLADYLSNRFPGTITLALDGSFPFFNGFPLLPHLSHDDGRKLDLAFYYKDGKGEYLPGRTSSAIGYFDFEEGPTDCPSRWASLRWDLPWLQHLWRDHKLESVRTGVAVTWLAKDGRVGKVFLEPHLRRSLGVEYQKVRFQGCRAARHDDHIHFQLR